MNKDKVVICGFGKIGLIHAQKFMEMDIPLNVIETNEKRQELAKGMGLKVYSSMQDLPYDDYVFDICLPNTLHLDWVKKAVDWGSNKVILEKPATTSLEELEDLEKIVEENQVRLVVNENYLYSHITAKVLDIVNKYGIKPNKVYSDFSKNRMADFHKKRGHHLRHPHITEMEVPHQISMMLLLLRPHSCSPEVMIDSIDVDNPYFLQTDIRFDDKYWLDLRSDLKREGICRELVISDGEYRVYADYCSYAFEIAKPKPGLVQLWKNNRLLESHDIYDDNMNISLRTLYDALCNDDNCIIEPNMDLVKKTTKIISRLNNYI